MGRPVLCLVTPALPATPGDDAALLTRIAAAAHAGVPLIQMRQPGLDARRSLHCVRRAVDAVRRTATRIVVNDRLDIALAAGAHGVHLRGDSFPAARLRTLVPPGFLVGRSVHGTEEAEQVTREGGLDYLVVGTIFSSASKPGAPAAGLDLLASVAARVPLPVLAVGGVTIERVAAVMRAGAAGAAAISLFDVPAGDIAGVVARVRDACAAAGPGVSGADR